MMMKINFFIVLKAHVMTFERLSNKDLIHIRGGAEPVRPISRPREDYDDEKAQSSYSSSIASPKDEALEWVEWLKNWLGKT